MRKFFILCLMAFVMCSCNNTPTIQKETIISYDGEMVFNEVFPTEKNGYFIYEYNAKGKLILSQAFDYEDFLYMEETNVYEKNELKSVHRWIQFDKDSDRTEHLWYKENDKWYRNTNGEITPLDTKESEQMNNPIKQVSFLPINDDGTFTILEEDYQCIGKVVETDEFGNWTKVVGKEKIKYDSIYLDDTEGYVVYIREIIYH